MSLQRKTYPTVKFFQYKTGFIPSVFAVYPSEILRKCFGCSSGFPEGILKRLLEMPKEMRGKYGYNIKSSRKNIIEIHGNLWWFWNFSKRMSSLSLRKRELNFSETLTFKLPPILSRLYVFHQFTQS